ncbi:hypothetical protein CQW23_23598 [Capsicum baccatum]|uniref:Leucine-rich repeat-containing N-terminal plant-type domain-containing protein n=1 Tax=Capsicum baccatum TaxID=33114 RepID=A0A2G2VSE9_CAPBA|nr:hypothetical protein CQW23_23598 [Capsicum baccatum]
MSVNMSALWIILLGFNGFTDIIKQESAKCFRSSQILELQHNEIHGEFPLILTNNSVLTSLDVSWNLFSGKIPSAIGNLWRLQKLRMINNSLEGDLRSLKTLSLGRNHFSIFIPSSFSKLTDLESMSLGGNGLNESLPDEVMSLSNLSILNLSRNKFSGTIPSSIGTLYKLTVVDLSGQNFSEEIPFDLAVSPDLDNCSTLVNLDLHSNSLSGQISVDLRHLSHLSVLDLGRNNLMVLTPTNSDGFWRKRRGSGAGVGGRQIWALGNDNRLAMMAIGSQVPTKRKTGRRNDAPENGEKKKHRRWQWISRRIWYRGMGAGAALTFAGSLVADFNGF